MSPYRGKWQTQLVKGQKAFDEPLISSIDLNQIKKAYANDLWFSDQATHTKLD
jgi:hypothetical protein